MDQNDALNNLVPEDLLKTNRLPTNEEREIIQQSVAPFNAKLQVLGMQISSLRLQIQEVKDQVNRMEGKLQRLCDEEAAVMEASAAHRRALSPFRALPDDILREICMACMDDENYPTTWSVRAMPLILARISSGMRNIALTTPILWASVHIEYRQSNPFNSSAMVIAIARRGARGVKKWFQRAGRLPLNISMTETNDSRSSNSSAYSDVLIDVLLSYSSRWRDIKFNFASLSGPTLTRIAALNAADVPLLRSLSLAFRTSTSALHHGTILTTPTLKHLFLDTQKRDVSEFSVSWANITVLHIHGNSWVPENVTRSVAKILQQATRLVNCSINMGTVTEIGYTGEIFLPRLQSLSVVEIIPRDTPEVPGLLKFINAPVLEALNLSGAFSTSSLSALFQRSPVLQNAVFAFDGGDFTDLMESLYHCRSLVSLVINAKSHNYDIVQIWNDHLPTLSNAFFEAFVCDGERGYLCPRLRTFIFTGEVYVSMNAIRQFLIGKRIGHGTAGLHSWIKVVMAGIYVDQDSTLQMRDVLAEQRAAGLDVSLS